MRSCLTCKHNFPDHDNEPCTACFGGSMWESDKRERKPNKKKKKSIPASEYTTWSKFTD